MTSSLLRRALRVPLSSSSPLLRRHGLPLSYSSLASSPSSPLLGVAVARSPAVVPHSLRFLGYSFSFSSSAHSNAKADEKLKRVLESEIECAKESQEEEVDVPDDFPFEIIDNPGDQTIMLKRQLAGESIQVTVFTNFGEKDYEEGDQDSDEDDNNEAPFPPTISLVVSIDKGDDRLLEFCCNVNPDELEIESMALKKRDDPDDQGIYQGPEFSELDENLQKALRTFLEVRGIKSSLFNFLNEYMTKKDDREYLAWLNNMKAFIEK